MVSCSIFINTGDQKMSRTYRRAEIELPCNCGSERRERWISYWKTPEWYIKHGIDPKKVCYCGIKYDYFSRRNLKRDKKPWYKSPKDWKQMFQRRRRARARKAMALGQYELIPVFKRENDWSWT